MFCENCGKKIDNNSGFCPACGKRVSDVGAKIPQQPIQQAPIASQQPMTANGVPTVKKTNGTTVFLIIAIAVVTTIILILAVTFPKSGENDIITNTQGLTNPAQSNGSGGEVAITPVTMSDNLFDYTVELDGVVYKFPCDYSDFTDNGWKISDYYSTTADTMVNGESDICIAFEKGEDIIEAYPYNYSGNAKKVSECKIGGFGCSFDEEDPIVLAKGITVTSTLDEIKDAYGEPNSFEEYNSYKVIEYIEAEFERYINFTFDSDGKFISFEIYNFEKTEDDKTETNDNRPAYLDEYKAPKSLGSNTGSGNFKLEGKIYRLPVPLSILLDDGWKISQKPGAVAAGKEEYLLIEKGKVSLRISVNNFAEYQTTVENCAVTNIFADDMVYGDDELPSFELPGKNNGVIKIGTTKTDLEKNASVTLDLSDYTSSYSYSYFAIDKDYNFNGIGVRFEVDKTSKKINEIHFYNDTWDY